MIYVDTNVFVYAVGRPHPLRTEAQNFFLEARTQGKTLVTSSEAMQELLHIYLPVRRFGTLDHALRLAMETSDQILAIDSQAVLHARLLADEYPALSARDLLHFAVCQLQDVAELKSFDRGLSTAFNKR